MQVDDLVYVAFNSRVAALDPSNGNIVWDWKASKGSGFVSLLAERETLYVSVRGYIYALDARSGDELWMNPMRGFGFGVTSIATARQSTSDAWLGAAQAQQQAHRQAQSMQHHHFHG